VIEQLRLENFRGFERHDLPLRATSVLVGANNAGKSTAVEALRLIALVAERFRRPGARFSSPPEWLDDHPMSGEGVAPAIRGITAEGFEPSIFHQYNEPPASISAEFSTGASIVVFIGPEAQVHAIAMRSDGSFVNRATPVSGLGFEAIAVQPQVAPVLRKELRRQLETIQRGDGTYLAPQHFRNQLWWFNEHFNDFKRIAEETWRDLQVKELIWRPERPEDPLQLLIRDGGFVGEVGLMGHGLQMWLQIVWFLARAPREGTVVLDEPDVYMHPDLQRRLLELVRTQFAQLLVATHSVEIISDVDPKSILEIDKRSDRSQFVTTLPGLQGVMDGLGSVQNIQLMRLMGATSFFLVEGEDVKLLRIMQATARPDDHPIDLIPNSDLGGRGGWGAGVPERIPSRNARGDRIRAYAILDRDYYPDAEVKDRYAEAKSWSIELHVWGCKELENYLLVPSAIARLIEAGLEGTAPTPTPAEVEQEIDRIIEGLRQDPIEYAFATNFLARDKKGGLTKASKAARKHVAAKWKNRRWRWSVAPGKTVISALSSWSQDKYKVSFGPEQIARELESKEIDAEVVDLVASISDSRPLK
jgi:hypothetical protein